MLNIQKTVNDKEAVISLEGSLDTVTAPEFEQALKEVLPGLTELTLDFADLEYISSAGLRVLLYAQNTMDPQCSMKVTNVNDYIMEVFEVTGFSDFLTIV